MSAESSKRTNPLAILTEQILSNRTAVKPNKKIKVGLVELGNSFSGGLNAPDQYYLPLVAGMLQSYAQKYLTYAKDYEFQLPIYKFMRIEESSEMLSECDLVGFSSYVWNEQNSLAIAKDYKRRKPNGLVIFGGPQVPDSKKQFRRNRTVELDPDELKRKRIHFTEDFHHAHSFIDLACHGEGERIFKIILEQMAIDGCRDKSTIPQISFLDNNGNFHFNMKLERMGDKELAGTPSPFTTGIFDKLMAAFPDQKWIKRYETDRGCPYQCSYCDWGGATEDKVSKFPMEQIYADIMWAGEHQISYTFLCNANFGILTRDVQIAEFFIESKAKFGYPEAVSTQNAKNPKPHTIRALKILEKAGLNKATVMSQQSLNPGTLEAVRRDNMKLDEYSAMQKELAGAGILTMTDIIPGMPEETYDSILDGISTLITNGQHNHIHFNNLSILRNTEMGNPEYQERYGMEIVRTPIINTHGKRNDSISGIKEYQELVIATNTMSRKDWVRTHVLCYMVTLLYFDKLLQIPIMVLHEVYHLPYGQIFKTIMEKAVQSETFPILAEIYNSFEKMVKGIQEGQEEYVHSKDYLDIWWPTNELVFIELCKKNKLAEFYQEAEKLLVSCLGYQPVTDILSEAVKLNQSLIKLPFQTSDLELTLSYNIWEFYRAGLVGKSVAVVPGCHQYTFDRTTKTTERTERWDSWEEWYQKVVWWGNRQGAHLYGNKNPHQEIAGHH
ncbi:MAG: B12-binding domain-containing radical SAM protein [bacterium]|nr:B12-binding domain-containing radical SAM protein [bacterium]